MGKLIVGVNDLATKNPKLAMEWNYEKNVLKPTEVTEFSNKKAWWKCKLGHEWKAAIYSRGRGHGCPYCSGLKAIIGVNDLATKNPELAKEWHPTLNKLSASEVTTGSDKKAWWGCRFGHEYRATINHRSNGDGCPYCSGRKVIIGVNDLATKNPKLAKEWHPILNKLSPSEVTKSSGQKVWWRCKLGHEWESIINSRSNGAGCPYCSSQKVLKGFNDLATKNPELAKEWHPTRNKLLPSEVTKSSDQKAWWRCRFGHEYRATINHRSNGDGCPYCSGRKVLKGFNDLATKNPELAKEWHPTLNKLLSSEVTTGCCAKAWWICELGHEWKAVIYSRSNGCGCPYCSGRKAIIGVNDLTTKNPELAKEWHPTLNKLSPLEVTKSSGQKVWWRCRLGHEWEATIANRNNGRGCPVCNESKLEKTTALHLDNLNIRYIREHKFTDCRNKLPLPFDFYLPDLNVCIECQGIQHYKKEYQNSQLASGNRHDDEDLNTIVKRDKIKHNYCKQNNIKLIKIKYTKIDKIDKILLKELGALA